MPAASKAALKMAGLMRHPFFSGFDYTLTRFNSVASYSEPAAYRLMRANCGQARHEALEAPALGARPAPDRRLRAPRGPPTRR